MCYVLLLIVRFETLIRNRLSYLVVVVCARNKTWGLVREQHIVRKLIISSEKKQLLKLASLRLPGL